MKSKKIPPGKIDIFGKGLYEVIPEDQIDVEEMVANSECIDPFEAKRLG